MLPMTDRNTEIDADYVEAAFQALLREGTTAEIGGDLLPALAAQPATHLQGVAIRESRAIVTRNRCILTAVAAPNAPSDPRNFDTNSIIQSPHDDQYRHLGGVQTIGDWFVVGAENASSSEIRFYRFENNVPTIRAHLTIRRMGEKAGAVGITDYQTRQGRRYLLAVCPDDEHIDFYRSTKPNVPLSEGECRFPKKPSGRWTASSKHGYVNAISLLADNKGQVYLVGLKGSGTVDVYRVTQQTPPALKKILSRKVKCKNNTSFRWGGSVLVTESRSVRMFACAWKIRLVDPRKRRGKRYVRLNIFR